jgi:hypothetical protein
VTVEKESADEDSATGNANIDENSIRVNTEDSMRDATPSLMEKEEKERELKSVVLEY